MGGVRSKLNLEGNLQASGFRRIAGVDEAGRGACAGPLVVAAVVLENPADETWDRLADSKTLSPALRDELYELIMDQASATAVIEISVEEVDARGVHLANLEGMRQAVAKLHEAPDYVLTDGYAIEGLAIPSLGVWKGDGVCRSIAAASILAKVHRDRLMEGLELQFPGYFFRKHKGYATAIHRKALLDLGPSRVHRISFANVSALLGGTSFRND